MSISGDPDGPAVLYGVPIVDIMGGFQGIYAALSALFYKGISGQGQWIDISLFEAAAYCQEYKLLHYTKLGELFWRVGSRWVPMCRSYTAKDGDVFIMSGAGLRGAIIFEVIGREDVLKDPRWPENPFKPLDEDVLLEFDAIIDEWVKSKTVSEIVDICVSRKVIAAPVCNVAQMVNDPQYIARNALVEVDHPVAGKLKFQGIAANLSLTPGRVDTPAPLLGEHNNYVYGNLLKYSKEEISKMSENGVI
jgi:CoA:oxalate CoA-transferase